MFKRLHNLWNLSQYRPQPYGKKDGMVALLTENQIGIKQEDGGLAITEKGDGKAVFFGSGTEQELKEQELEDSGMKGWIDRLKNL